MKKQKKIFASLLTVATTFCVLGNTVLAYDIHSTIDENGTICTIEDTNQGTRYIREFPMENSGRYEVTLFPSCELFVAPTDVEAFQTYCEEQEIYTEDSRRHYFAAYSSETDSTATESTAEEVYATYPMDLEKGIAVTKDLIEKKLAKSVSIGRSSSYLISNDMPLNGWITVVADRTLTEEDFSWLDEGYTVEISETGRRAKIDGLPQEYKDFVRNLPEDDENGAYSSDDVLWSCLYQVMRTSLEEIEGVTAVDLFTYNHAIAHRGTQPYKEYGIHISGDITGDLEINTKDAYETLMYCAKIGAGYEDAAFSDDEIEHTAAYAAADVNGDGEINTDDAYQILKYRAMEGAGLTPEWD